MLTNLKRIITGPLPINLHYRSGLTMYASKGGVEWSVIHRYIIWMQ